MRQFGKIVVEYEIKLRKLVEFVPELANSEECLCFKFEEGLTLEIQKKMSILGGQSYKKKFTSEKMSRGKFEKRKGFRFVLGQSSKKKP